MMLFEWKFVYLLYYVVKNNLEIFNNQNMLQNY